MDDLNKQQTVETTSFFASRHVSRAAQQKSSIESKTMNQTALFKPTPTDAKIIRKYLENMPAKLQPMSVKAEALKA